MTEYTRADNFLLYEGLRFAVPLHIAEMVDLPFRERCRLAGEAAQVVASQGDTLQYGSKGTSFGDGARQLRQHQAHGDAKDDMCASCEQGRDQARCCLRRFRDKCGVCTRGQVTYSAGEVFNFMARGLALLACQPGGVTFAGMHWCAWPHPRCPNSRTLRKPPCCTCGDGECPAGPGDGYCRGCRFCANGCAAAGGQPCCRTLAPTAERRPDEAYGSRADGIEDVRAAGKTL